MVIEIQSFDGFDLQDAIYSAGFPYQANALSRSASPVVLPVIGGYARDEGFDHKPLNFHIEVLVEGTLTTGMEALKQAFRVGRSGNLVVSFDGTERYRVCRVEGAFPFARNSSVFVVNFVTADPRWRAVTDTVVANTVNSDGETWVVTNAGNAAIDDAVITFAPQTQKAATAAQLYRRYGIIANRAEKPLSDWPVDITNGGINHAALVSGGKSQTNGADVRVLEDGVETPRFFGEHADNDANSLTTKVWCKPRYSARAIANLRSAITNVSPADGESLAVQSGQTAGWPRKGAFVNPTSNEVIRYDGIADPDVDGFDGFLNVKRGQWGTTAASGSAADALYRVEHKLELIYGNTAIAAPESRPDVKPIINLASSTLTNIRHEWVDWWDDTYPSRPGGWVRRFEQRDEQAGFLFANRGSPAATADFLYNYYNPPVDRDNFNVMYRDFPTGTSGASGQIAMTRVIDATLMAEVRGILHDGTEHLLASLRGPLASATFTSAFLQKLYGVTVYNRSQVAISTPEMDGSPLADQMGSSSFYAQVNAVNTSGNIYGAYVNETGDLLRITGVQVLVWQPGSPKTAITVSVRADDGAGAPSINELGQATIASGAVASLPTWHTFTFARPWPWAAGQKIHLNVQSGGASSSNTLWGHQPMEHAGAFPMRGARYFADGEIVDYARAEGGGGAVYAPAAGENNTFDAGVALLDSAATPYFALKAEQACYQANHTLTNLATGQSLTFNLYISPGDVIEVDCGRRTVRNLTTDEDGLLYGLQSSDPDGFFTIASGPNTLQWDEAGVVDVDTTVTFRAAWE